MALPWIVSVLSTDYDLQDYRKAVIDELKKKNIRVSAFEEPDFPVEPDQHSHDSCLTALSRADIAILIIDKRYGGISYSSDGISITEQEFRSAIEKKIPYLVFVSKETWDERDCYHKELKESGISEEDFKSNYVCKHVNDIKVIKFVDFIQHIYDKNKCSNWISTFNSIQSLIDEINGKLAGLSRFFFV